MGNSRGAHTMPGVELARITEGISAMPGDSISKSDLLAFLSNLESPKPEAAEADAPKIDGVSDFKAGQRDFSIKPDQQSTTTQIKADFESKEKRYTNGIVAPNRPRTHVGPLSGEAVNIPDVNSGYPKSVYPTAWDGQFPSAIAEYDRGEKGLPDVNEHRIKIGVVIPSTNTTVEYDFWRILFSNQEAMAGVGIHVAGILIDSPKLTTDEDMLEFLAQFRRQIFITVDRLMTAEPEYITMGMSLETFFGGWEGNKEFKAELQGRTGLNIATGAEACRYALEKFEAKKICIFTPYADIGDRNVVKFFEEIGCEVLRIAGLKCGSATDIAHVPESWCEKIIREDLASTEGCEAIVQCGTNLSMVSLADRLEHELGIPIIPINTACLWFAMREVGIEAKLQGCTRLFREH